MVPLLDRLPEVRGSYRENHDIAPLTWFRVGGPAQVFFRPADPEDLAHFIANKPDDVPVYVVGVGSNTLLRDGGFPGVVIRLGGKEFGRIDIEGTRLTAGAAALDATVAKTAAREGLAGPGVLCRRSGDDWRCLADERRRARRRYAPASGFRARAFAFGPDR